MEEKIEALKNSKSSDVFDKLYLVIEEELQKFEEANGLMQKNMTYKNFQSL